MNLFREKEMMISPPATSFLGKRWIYFAQAIIFGFLGISALMLGPAFYFGYIERANGDQAVEAGIALLVMSVPCLALTALALYNIRVRRNPVLRIYREGIAVTFIGASTYRSALSLPAWIQVALSILSLQGFRSQTFGIPWYAYRDSCVVGLPMARRLFIFAPSALQKPIDLPQVMFVESLDRVVDSIRFFSNEPTRRDWLPSWNEFY